MVEKGKGHIGRDYLWVHRKRREGGEQFHSREISKNVIGRSQKAAVAVWER